MDALCREDAAERLAQAHCKISSESDRFFVSDMGTCKDGTELDGFVVSDTPIGPLKTGSLLTVGPLRIKFQLSEMAKDTPLVKKKKKKDKTKSRKRARGGSSSDDSSDAVWKGKVHRPDREERLAAKKKVEVPTVYKDRAEERRQKQKGEAGSIAIDNLVNKFNKIQEAELAAQEAEDARVEAPTMEAHREANMGIDGTFLGGGGTERAGIGFHSQAKAELIPNVVDPKSLSHADRIRMQTQMRFDQAHR